MKKRTFIFILGLSFTAAQTGFAQVNYHSANKLKLVFSNDGVIDSETGLEVEWPVGTGQEYLDLALPLVVVKNGSNLVIPSFSVVNAYVNPNLDAVAMNHLKDTWPDTWPDKPASWDGGWLGYFGLDQLNADQESLIVLEDSNRGLRLTIRGWQWAHYLAQDMIFWHYELSNIGSTDYEELAFGFFTAPNVGGDSDQEVISYQAGNATATVIDVDNAGRGRGTAKDIRSWTPVGRFSVRVLETPGNASDGIDNDNDNMIDESRADGIDNDGDWLAGLHDVGEDGIANSGDAGEGDNVPSPGEPNFDATDIDESDQVGVSSFSVFDSDGLDITNASDVWAGLASGVIADPEGKTEFIMGSALTPLAAGETQRLSVTMFMSVNEDDQAYNEEIIGQIYDSNYRFPVGPPAPEVTAVALNGRVTLYWDNRSEQVDSFEGYKIYKSTDPGFNDIFSVTNDRGVVVYSKVNAIFDLDNSTSDLFNLNANGFRYFLGNNTGLRHWWTDENVLNGKTYYYAVVAYDRGDVARQDFPAESSKSIVVEPSGQIHTTSNTIVVTPVAETSVYQAPGFDMKHAEGFATGLVEIEVVDRTGIREGGEYQLTFDDTSAAQTSYSLLEVSDPANPVVLIDRSNNFSTDDVRNDLDPIFDGLHLFIFNNELAWNADATRWQTGDSNWEIALTVNSNLGPPELEAVDYEVRFGEAGIDTALFSTPIPVPFQVWNITENKKANILVLDQNGDAEWNSGENIFVVTGKTLQDFRPVKWTITLTAPEQDAVAPQAGDVAIIPTFKPFSAGDVYTITTNAITSKDSIDKTVLDDIAVVPNPYIVNSTFEQRSLYTGGQLDRQLHFIHLPTQCRIRIFDMRGRLLNTIDHDSSLDDGSATWDLVTKDGEVVAYGIYVYHVEAQGIGNKLGRFAVIR